MNLFGDLPHGTFLNPNDNFENIFSASRFLFQVSTGQAFPYLMEELI